MLFAETGDEALVVVATHELLELRTAGRVDWQSPDAAQRGLAGAGRAGGSADPNTGPRTHRQRAAEHPAAPVSNRATAAGLDQSRTGEH